MSDLARLLLCLSLLGLGSHAGAESDRWADCRALVTSASDPSASAGPSGSFDALVAEDRAAYSALSSLSIRADGHERGVDAYTLFRDALGPRAIEAPDLFVGNHVGKDGEPGVDVVGTRIGSHIVERTDSEVGEHFVFVLHRDEDRDRAYSETSCNREAVSACEKQRNEVKVYGASDDELKGFEGETMIYSWMFRLDSGLRVSPRHTHVFQLKASGSRDDGMPLVVLNAYRSNGAAPADRGSLELQFGDSGHRIVPAPRVDLADVSGVWLRAYVRATFANEGELRVILSRVDDGETILDVTDARPLWRGDDPKRDGRAFVRPKWGIYRSLQYRERLSEGATTVRFADFRIDKVVPR